VVVRAQAGAVAALGLGPIQRVIGSPDGCVGVLAGEPDSDPGRAGGAVRHVVAEPLAQLIDDPTMTATHASSAAPANGASWQATLTHGLRSRLIWSPSTGSCEN
jgi:hypothetical protein